ncbi:peptidase propeptide and YpeB domain protein [Lachnoanaerobaculum saburreum F0468]|jgi:peptidase propeptide and YPEB domain protein|uniref:Peptidase propeptide and YpeB domain protein n=1 Tax=Lachnoanaerobaculum saburreum F0468 TaxID=1095750 RepID=I0RAX9_9FIRM|nr:PepSY domain-containing protein [Lachnoanaerobaculum saburreum]EIC96837.1 peptidase propeptide and YpeB domain protein [Lachnoanaerobaculum saburreum F0468]
MKKFNGLSKGFMGVATVACLLFAAGVTGVPYYGSVGTEAVGVAKKANKANKTKKISADKAKRIALGDAKLAEKDVTFVKVELELEDNRLVYDVEFYSGNVEYDYDIDAVSGAIVSADKDIENYVIPAQPSTEAPTKAQASEISVEKAKQIALSHAGVGSARFTKAKIDYENGVKVYEIEFKVGNMEYEYDINVLNGAIVSSSAEIDD